MADHKGFERVIKEGWDTIVQGYDMHKIWGKLKQVKIELKKLHNK